MVKKMRFYLHFLCLVLGGTLSATRLADWKEFPRDPVHTPYSAATLPDDYFPCVIFNANGFDGNGAAFLYKMWHQSPHGIALSYSNDGANWALVSEVVTDTNAPLHASVVYDKNGFGGGLYYYKMWYWTGTVSFSPPALAIKFTQSVDGVTWTTPVATTQDSTCFLADGTQSDSYFYQFYGFGTVLYNSSATSIPGQPFTFPYVAFFDSSAAEETPQTTQEAVGLAYSSDGLNWFRYGAAPVLIPAGNTTDWDGKYAYRASVIQFNGIYYMLYSGSSEINNPDSSFSYTYGIGIATSPDGITWTRDSGNPIFTIADRHEDWRSGRTLAPSLVVGPIISREHFDIVKLRMWFSGGTNAGSNFATAAIGLATSSLLVLP